MTDVQSRLEYLRGELRAERISQGELLELQSLAEHIDPGDVELLEAAGVQEHPSAEWDPEDPDTKGEMVFVYRTDLQEFLNWFAAQNVDVSGMNPRQSEALDALWADADT